MFKRMFLISAAVLTLSSCAHANQFKGLQEAFDAYQDIIAGNFCTEKESDQQKMKDISEWLWGDLKDKDPNGITAKDLKVKLLGGTGERDNFTDCSRENNRNFREDRSRCDNMKGSRDERMACERRAEMVREQGRNDCKEAYPGTARTAEGLIDYTRKWFSSSSDSKPKKSWEGKADKDLTKSEKVDKHNSTYVNSDGLKGVSGFCGKR